MRAHNSPNVVVINALTVTLRMCRESRECYTSTDLCRVSAERAASVDNALKAQTHLAQPPRRWTYGPASLGYNCGHISTAYSTAVCAVCPSRVPVSESCTSRLAVPPSCPCRCPACIRSPFRFRLDPCSLYFWLVLGRVMACVQAHFAKLYVPDPLTSVPCVSRATVIFN